MEVPGPGTESELQLRPMPQRWKCWILFFFFFFCLFAISWAAPSAYGGSQARGLIGAVAAWPTPEPQQRQIRAASATYTTAHSNAVSLTH